MKVLVCGGRDYEDESAIQKALDERHRVISFTHLIHGDCSGADRIAAKWARVHGVQPVACEALWNFGRSAGPIRNRRMLELSPDLVIAFPGGIGTADMMRQAREANIDVWQPTSQV
jgi:hypothetical protein